MSEVRDRPADNEKAESLKLPCGCEIAMIYEIFAHIAGELRMKIFLGNDDTEDLLHLHRHYFHLDGLKRDGRSLRPEVFREDYFESRERSQ